MKKIIYNKYASYILYGLCLLYIIYFTIVWALPYFELLQDRIKATSSGYQFIDTSGGVLTIRNLSVYLLIRLIMVISALLLLIKRSNFSVFFFIVMFSPLVSEFVIFISKNLESYLDYLGVKGTFDAIHRELIYSIVIILIFSLSIIPNPICENRLKINMKMFLIFILSLGCSFYLYFRFSLKF